MDTQHFVTISDCSNEGDMTSATCRTSGICAAANRRTKLVNCINRGNQLNSCPGPDKGRIGNIACNVSNVIVSMTKKLMADIPFKDVIATGTCLQNLRTSSLNNDMCLTRDGYHMDEDDKAFLVHDYVREHTPYIDVVERLHPGSFQKSTFSGKRIDFVYMTEPLFRKVRSAEIIHDGFATSSRDPRKLHGFCNPSDHYPIIIDLKF